jgi:hypothetical protein
MISSVIYYLIVGVILNFVYDIVVSEFNMSEEDTRFTLKERFIVTLIWPLVALFFVFTFFKNFLK